LNIIESLWSVWESGVRSRFPPPWSLKQPDVLHEEWYSIPLETIQNLHEPNPRRIQAVLQANGGPAPSVSFTTVPSILSVLCRCIKKLWRVRATIVAVETQQCILCVVEIHFGVKYINTFYVAQQCFYGKFMSPITTKRALMFVDPCIII
jgi:hypothetical protein